jgi:hypothetical protein
MVLAGILAAQAIEEFAMTRQEYGKYGFGRNLSGTSN